MVKVEQAWKEEEEDGINADDFQDLWGKNIDDQTHL